MSKFKIGDLVKVYKKGLQHGEVILIQMDMYLVKLVDIEEPDSFYEHEMELDLKQIRNDKLSELLG